jgi:hypothetical protein
MANNIQTFYQVAQRQDFARLFQFQLAKFGNLNLNPVTDLVYVETASLPGRQINNIQVPYMGLQFNVPGTASYPGSAGYNVTFRCDQNYNIRDILEASSFNTFSDSSSTGNYATPAQGSDIVLWLLDKNGAPTREYTLFGAYVQALQDTAYDIKDNGTIATVQATIAYQFWRLTNKTVNDLGAIGTPGRFGPNP